MELNEFFYNYLTKSTNKERLDFVGSEAKRLINNDKNIEASALPIFIELLSENSEKTQDEKESALCLPNDELLQHIRKGLYHLLRGRRKRSIDDLKISKECLESAKSKAEDILFLHIRLARVYRYLGVMDEDANSSINFQESVKLIQTAISRVEDKFILASFYNELGDTYLDMRNYNAARDSYQEAINTCDDFPFAHTGMGNYLRGRGEYMDAIKAYKNALDRLKYEDGKINNHNECVYPLNYTGDCYRYIEDYAKAEERYIKAILIDPSKAFPWHGLGRVHYELGNRNGTNKDYYKLAMKYFEKALEIDDKFKYLLHSCASNYYKMEEYEKAKEYYSKSLEALPKSSYHNEWADKRITEIEDEQKLLGLHKKLNEGQLDMNLLPEEKVIINTVKTKKRVFQMEDSFTQTFLRPNFYNNEDEKDKVVLEVLRRWNSYTPIITDNSKGGGYFIKAYGKGIVMDPGFNFIDNFKDLGHTFAEIDRILITHSHDDHTADLESIINLLYRYNKELKDKKIKNQIAKEKNISTKNIDPKKEEYKSVIDERSNEFKKILSLYVSEGVMKKYDTYFRAGISSGFIMNAGDKFDRNNKETYVVRKMNPQDVETTGMSMKEGWDKGETPPIILSPIKAKHIDIIEEFDSIGFKIEFEDTVLIYTGDTGWNSEMETQYSRIGQLYKGKKKIVLIAHIGSFKEDEDKLIDYLLKKDSGATVIQNNAAEQRDLSNYLYKNHLGRIGMVKINEALQPDMCIISEFGEEFKGLRREVTESIRLALKDVLKDTQFIPADIGLNIDLVSLKIRAIDEIDYENRRLKYDYIGCSDVKVGEYNKLNQLFYYNQANVSENDCLQAISNDFTENVDDICTIEKYNLLKQLLLGRDK